MSYPVTRSKCCIGFSCYILFIADTITELTCLSVCLDLCLTYSRLPSTFYLQSATSASDRLDSRSASGPSPSAGGVTSHRLDSRSVPW